MSDMKVFIEAHNCGYYPDVFVVCDSTDDNQYVKRLPCVVVEVLSDSLKLFKHCLALFGKAFLVSVQNHP